MTTQHVQEMMARVRTFAELRRAEDQAWEVRDGVIDRRFATKDEQERRLLAVTVDFLGDVASELARVASDVYNRKVEG